MEKKATTGQALKLNSWCDGAADVESVRLSFIVASSFSESRKRMAGEELSLFTANLNVLR